MGMLLVRKRRKNKTVIDTPKTESVNLTEVNGEEEPQIESINLTEVNGEEEPQIDFNNMTVADLKKYAEENSIDLNGATKKADIINEMVGK